MRGEGKGKEKEKEKEKGIEREIIALRVTQHHLHPTYLEEVKMRQNRQKRCHSLWHQRERDIR